MNFTNTPLAQISAGDKILMNSDRVITVAEIHFSPRTLEGTLEARNGGHRPQVGDRFSIRFEELESGVGGIYDDQSMRVVEEVSAREEAEHFCRTW